MQTIDFNILRLKDGNTLLDVGCGEGRHTLGAYMTADVTAIGVDISERDLRTACERQTDLINTYGEFPGRVLFQRADALRLPFPDHSFDRVICSEVLEHIDNYQGVLAEITRVLKPDGLLAISVPRAWPEEICWRLSAGYRQSEGGHIRIFNATQLRFDVEQLGWVRYSRHWAHALHAPFWWLKCLLWGRDDHPLVRGYHAILVWDLIRRPWLTRGLEWLLNPILGKSVVMYFKRAPTDG